MGRQVQRGEGWDPARIAASDKRFWAALWTMPVTDAVYECGIDMVRFGPVLAACVAEEPTETGLNFILGSGEAGAVEHGHLADAAAWLESRCLEYDGRGVDYRVPVVPGLPDSEAAVGWLQDRGARHERGPAKLVRDTSVPGLSLPPGIEVLDWNEWDEGFSGPLAESLGLPGIAETFFCGLLELDSDTWRCYCAADDVEPLAYAAMHIHSGVATLALASRPNEGRDGEGQTAILHRCITDAAEAGCDMIVVADAGLEPPVVDRESMIRAGFEAALRTPIWLSRVKVGA